MAKRSRDRRRHAQEAGRETGRTAPAGEVGPRQPCPCGSGRRYKACHGSPSGAPPVFVARPFQGLAGECDLVAMREFVPVATAPVTVTGHEDRSVTLCSLLPGAAPALVRQDGAVWVGLQVQHAYGDASRDLAATLLTALDTEPGRTVEVTEDPGPGPRLQDLLAGDTLAVQSHDGFDYWLAGVEDPDGSLSALVENANGAVPRSQRLTTVEAAYWADAGDKGFLRWAMPYDEAPLLDALARLRVAGGDRLVEGARLIGMFRADGLLVPVWEVPAGVEAEGLEDAAGEVHGRIVEALDIDGPLSPQERSARAGLASRQLTLR